MKGKRYLSEPSSDGLDEVMDDEGEEDDDAIMADEVRLGQGVLSQHG